MFFQKKHWSLISPMKNWRLDGLTKTQVSLVLQTLINLEKNTLWIWKKGWKTWKPYIDCGENFSEFENQKSSDCPEPPEIAQPRDMVTDYDSAITQVAILRKEIFASVRQYPRYRIELPIKIVIGNQVFDTRTSDISLGGLCVVSSLPDWVAGYCTAILSLSENESLELVCTIVEDQKNGQKTRMEFVASARFDELKHWIEKNNHRFERD